MTTADNSQVKAALDAINDLVDTARIRAVDAAMAHDWATREDLVHAATQLDAVRTRLIQEGPEHLQVAWAFIDGGREILARAQERIALQAIGDADERGMHPHG